MIQVPLPAETRQRLIDDTASACKWALLARTPWEDPRPRVEEALHGLETNLEKQAVLLTGGTPAPWEALAVVEEVIPGTGKAITFPFRSVQSGAWLEAARAANAAFPGLPVEVAVPPGEVEAILQGSGNSGKVLGAFSLLKVHRMKIQKALGRTSFPEYKVTMEWNTHFFEEYKAIRSLYPLDPGVEPLAFFASKRRIMERIFSENAGGIITLQGKRKDLVALVAIELRTHPWFHVSYYDLVDLVVHPDLQRKGIGSYLHLIVSWKMVLEWSCFLGGFIRAEDEVMTGLASQIHREPQVAIIRLFPPTEAEA